VTLAEALAVDVVVGGWGGVKQPVEPLHWTGGVRFIQGGGGSWQQLLGTNRFASPPHTAVWAGSWMESLGLINELHLCTVDYNLEARGSVVLNLWVATWPSIQICFA